MLTATGFQAMTRLCALALALSLLVVSIHQAFAHSTPGGDVAAALEIASHGHAHAFDDAEGAGGLSEAAPGHDALDHDHLMDLLPVVQGERALALAKRVTSTPVDPVSILALRTKRPPRA